MTAEACPLCGGGKTELFFSEKTREYRQCAECALVFVPARFHISPEREKARYDTHQNRADDERYRTFLSRLVEPLVGKLEAGAEGLDYGSGPTPVLSEMLAGMGYRMRIFDAYYAPDTAVFDRRYDFLTCCETIEHFREPRKEWERFLSLVKKGGWIGIMTELADNAGDFSTWYYRNDETHIGYYWRRTFEWLGRRYGVEVEFHGKSVVLVRR